MTETQAAELLAQVEAIRALLDQTLVAATVVGVGVWFAFGWACWVSFTTWIRRGNIL
jgi:hypothetical protein